MSSPLSPPSRRTDGRETAEALLQAAGEVFAEKGPAQATSKEIAARAGANAAAVNYYFGGIGPLYEAALLRAHERVLAWEELPAIAAADIPAEAKIRRIIGLHMEAVLGLGSHAWELRLISRELLAPSPALSRLHAGQAAPRMLMIDEIVAQVIGLPVEDIAVRQAAFCTMTPALMLLTGPAEMIQRIAGVAEPQPADLAQMAERLGTYAFGGMKALGTMVRAAEDQRTE